MAAKDDRDPILVDEQRLKGQKLLVQNLHKQLKIYNEAFRRYMYAEKAFYETLDNLCESDWELKREFSSSIQAMGNIAENGARSLETIPVEETIVFRDQFDPFEKEILDYKDKQKIAATAERKHVSFLRKKSHGTEELRKLELIAYEKKTSLGILRRKLTDELPTFYNSRMDFYSTFWRSVFQIRADIARAECDTLNQLTELVRRFDTARSHGSYLCTGTANREGEYNEEQPTVNESAAADSGCSTEPRWLQQRQQHVTGIRRVPTFGGNDLASESSALEKPPLPRRSSLRSQLEK